ncbi:uncharacterized protein BX663DRAFT_539692 [Cokeromyces recurvatus]|uniref:uncharacterized protein n=1 Tax=Cokeromyces recurvatus TaxID=90255 RepID=UPI002220938F|nr:uncharacterized protein BX663DRAFT_539692 [Cokeromyces recurvatus]KAI7906904.1 hypothetical protein BX663DRAFT_539692 [Cokeromyces recurvatus]
MTNPSILQERSIVVICEHVSNYCEQYINSATNLSPHYLRSFHSFLPDFLVHVFGSPTTRGWIQTEIQPVQEEAIKKLLSINGPFFQALLKLSLYPEYSYILVQESLPVSVDIRQILSTGAIHLLPPVYKDCTDIGTSATTPTNPLDIKAAATRQSTLISSNVGGNRKIKLNILQFYLYYFVSVPTWPPLSPPSPSFPSTSSQPTFTTSFTNFTKGGTTTTTTTTATNTTVNNSKMYSYGTISNTSSTLNSSLSSNNTNTNPPHLIPGKLRTMIYSVYDSVLEEYLTQLIPIGTSNSFPNIVNTFLFDACMELWIRTTWVSSGQRLSNEIMHYITTFVKYIVKHNLRDCVLNERSLFYQVYSTLRDELYTLISRLALNWCKQDDYLQVVELWSIWAAPWRFGATPRSSEKQDYTPILHGWSPFILDNILYYTSLVNILLQRTSTFPYKDNSIQQQQQQQQQKTYTSGYNDGGTMGGHLRILYRIINVIKARELVELLASIEKGLEKFQTGSVGIMTGSPLSNKPFKRLSLIAYGTDKFDSVIEEKLKRAYDMLVLLEGQTGGIWKPKGLYTNDIQPRSEALLKTLNAIYNAILVREGKNLNIVNSQKAAEQLNQLKEVYRILTTLFNVTDTSHLVLNTSTTHTSQPKSITPTTNTSTAEYKQKLAGLSNGGFLTEKEIELVRQGKMICAEDNVPTVGNRSQNIARSYELSILVHWTLLIDQKLNFYYNNLLSENIRPSFLPKRLTTRPLANPVDIIYIVILLYIFWSFIRFVF